MPSFQRSRAYSFQSFASNPDCAIETRHRSILLNGLKTARESVRDAWVRNPGSAGKASNANPVESLSEMIAIGSRMKYVAKVHIYKIHMGEGDVAGRRM
jgi:hypothetical protein